MPACVFVIKSRNKLMEMESLGYDILFIGDKDHPEVKGVVSFGKRVLIFKNLEKLKEANLPKDKKYAILSQTTLNKNLFKEIKDYIDMEFVDAKVLWTLFVAQLM